jgi:hypothetical protein
MRRFRVASILALVVALLVPWPSAVADDRLRADLEGAPIRLADVGRHFCHDLDAPAIHCFPDLETLDAVVAERSKTSGVLAAAYVQVFVNRDYGGASAYLSANYPNLGTIGWNDRISSYKVLISGSGEFREHANYVGAIDEFCCTQWVTYVGDYYNDKFSSVRTP